MISLVPKWAHHYNEFWETIRKRNLWLIKLRYYAVLMLVFLIFTAEFLINIEFSKIQLDVLILTTTSILIYNLILHYVRKFVQFDNKKFNPLHISLFQMTFDLTALNVLIYFTGTVESPLYMFLIFHMIIGSLILPGKIVYSSAAIIILILTFLSYGEYNGLIYHHTVQNFLEFPLYNKSKYVFSFITIFSFVLLMSVVLANGIARQLYKMEQDLYESLDKIKKSEAEKQKYIMGVVHEIKTPIAAFHSYVELIINKFLGPVSSEIESKLKKALVRSTEAISLINNVLQISKLKLADDIEKTDVNLKDLLYQIIRQQKVNLESKKLTLTHNLDEIQNIVIEGNQMLLEIAFSNLINNSIKYNRENGRLILNCFVKENKIQIKIIDNGIGIPKHELDLIFKEFYRASNIKDKEGSGLGLTFVKQIIEKHNGTITVKSPSEIGYDKNPGCTFTISLPFLAVK